MNPPIILKPQRRRFVLASDELSSENMAMLLALYSRSGAGVRAHLNRVRRVGSAKFMREYYVGYNHKSIGDCGSTWMFFEWVSILCAKAIEDNSLFNGQETSTRYINMANQPIIDPINTSASQALLERLMKFYRKGIAMLTAADGELRKRYPKDPKTSWKTYKRAIAAKAFDMMRGFLPAGITTMVGWHTNFRQAIDQIQLMNHHPLAEVRGTAADALAKLQKKYPSSFGFKTYPATETYRAEHQSAGRLFLPDEPTPLSFRSQIDPGELRSEIDLLSGRPKMTELPRRFLDFGLVKWKYVLDYASWRDIQRHRTCTHLVSLLTTRIGFQQWYLEELPEELRTEAEELLEFISKTLQAMDAPDTEKQYLTPIGYNVNASASTGLPGAVYMLDLRSTAFIHPTLRALIHQMGGKLTDVHPEVTLHLDTTKSDWDVRRGDQTIVKKS